MTNTQKTDFTYRIEGFFAVFFPRSKEAEAVMGQLLESGGDKIFIAYLPTYLKQIKAAGWKVRKQIKSKKTQEQLLAEDAKLLKQLFN